MTPTQNRGGMTRRTHPAGHAIDAFHSFPPHQSMIYEPWPFEMAVEQTRSVSPKRAGFHGVRFLQSTMQLFLS